MVRILVVDDDRNTRKLFSEILAAEGYEVLSAANGVEALELMDTEQVHLAVVDVMMPEMDGLEFTKMLRQIGGDLPILMVSGMIAGAFTGFAAQFLINHGGLPKGMRR